MYTLIANFRQQVIKFLQMTTIDCLNISYVVCGVNFIVEIYFMYMWFWNKILLKLVKQKGKKLNTTTNLNLKFWKKEWRNSWSNYMKL